MLVLRIWMFSEDLEKLITLLFVHILFFTVSLCLCQVGQIQVKIKARNRQQYICYLFTMTRWSGDVTYILNSAIFRYKEFQSHFFYQLRYFFCFQLLRNQNKTKQKKLKETFSANNRCRISSTALIIWYSQYTYR